MNVSSSAGYATALNQLNVNRQVQTEQVRASSDQSQQVTNLLAEGGSSRPAATGGRGQVVDIQA